MGTIVGDYRGQKVLIGGYLGSRGPKGVKGGHRYTNRGYLLMSFRGSNGQRGDQGGQGGSRGAMRDEGILVGV